MIFEVRFLTSTLTVTGAFNDMILSAAEQAIAHWQEDSSVSSCPICESVSHTPFPFISSSVLRLPICSTSFHPLTNRKHHCRLCGRVVCSLPPRQPNRAQTCSLLITADYRTRRIEEIPDGIVDYGVTKKGVDPKADKEREAYLRSIRVCRDCHHTVSWVLSLAFIPLVCLGVLIILLG